MKYCPCCKINKEPNLFYKNKARKDGMDVYCIECKKEKANIKQQKKINKRLKEQFIEGEIWKDIFEFDKYEASTEGRIRNKTTKLLLKPCKDCKGYAVSGIRKKNIKFHRIIAKLFLPNFYNKPTVEHKDDNKLNNRLWNLKWATRKEQAQFVKDKGSRPSRKGIPIKSTKNMVNLDGEIWKIVPGFPEYEISSHGRIKYPIRKGVKPYPKRITYGTTNADGYKTFTLRNKEKKVVTGIHRIVAAAFIPNPENKPCVNHKGKDGNKQNNSVGNLEWVTKSENTQHAYYNNLISGKRCILQLDVNNNIIKEWDTIKNAYETLKLSRTAINHVLSGKNKTCGEYYWCYKENYDKDLKKHTLYDTNKRKVKQLDKETGNLIKIWNSMSEAAEYIGTKGKTSINAAKGNISQNCRDKRNSCLGYKWQYAN